ncbi:aspartate aminotransferase family protein [Fictibacillus aquaticus]|uniref:aspartate aminotransferase family protein n=1 Tax=Fictibacillus aquaticus TaxID=2021314 RepID=UPI001F0B30F3|nr:aspartate aminotransferase family protein [Fictibacillus aquaticus]
MNTHLIKPLVGESYPVVDYGRGIYLFGKDGKKYIDGSSGAVTANIGHGVKEIYEAMCRQAEKVSFVYRSHFTSEPAEELAEKLAQSAPGDLNAVFFVNSGSEATETALKVAIQYFQEQGQPEKIQILSRRTSYHGITLGSLSMSGHPLRRQRFEPLLEDFPAVAPPYCYQCPFKLSYPSCKMKCADDLEEAILSIGSENIAAFIAEPVIGASGGAITPPDEYYPRVKAICEKYNILFIADEVMTGMGRTGKMFAMDHWDVVPDIIATGKGMSAGYTPMAAAIVSDRIMKVIENGTKVIMSGHTFSANPFSAAVCLAVMDYMDKNNVVQNAQKQGIYLIEKLKKLQEEFEVIGDVRGKGLLCGIELVRDRTAREPFSLNEKITETFISICFENGLIVYPAVAGVTGFSGDAVIIAPPLTITSEEIDELAGILSSSLKQLTGKLEQEGKLILKRAN